jgi:hypothetical protein
MIKSARYSVSEIYPLHNLLPASRHMPERTLRVAKYVIENPKRVASMSIGELAKATGSNQTAVKEPGALKSVGKHLGPGALNCRTQS